MCEFPTPPQTGCVGYLQPKVCPVSYSPRNYACFMAPPTTPPAARTRPDGRSGVRSASSASARSICASTKGWERFVNLNSTGKLQCSPSTRSMPRVDARGRPSTAPAARTRSLPTLSAAREEPPSCLGVTAGSDVFDLTSVSEPRLQSPEQVEPRSDGAGQSRDVVTIEYCNVQRPSSTLRGTPEEFEVHALALKAFLEATFPSATVQLQKAPYGKRSKIPSTEIDLLRRHLTPQEKAAKAHPKLRYADGSVYVPTGWAGGRDGCVLALAPALALALALALTLAPARALALVALALALALALTLTRRRMPTSAEGRMPHRARTPD
eukprot:scaffold119368_cov63-Phaeocystis_antarctica.AAC.1